MATVTSFFAAVIAFEQAHWQGELAAAISQLPSIIVALTPYPKVDGFLKNCLKLLNVVSLLTHKDSPGTLKPPFVQSQPPVAIPPIPLGVATQSAPRTAGFVSLMWLAVLCLLSLCLGGCAAVSWNQPVFYYGPTVVPFEEVSIGSKNAQPATAGGIGATIGLGQYEMVGHEWDIIDTGPLALGGLVPGGNGPAGQLQLGWKVGTLNGLANAVVALDCIDSGSNGVCQGGNPHGVILGGSLDIQALVAYFGSASPSDAMRVTPRMPRGGL
jgi:hypothetical protein